MARKWASSLISNSHSEKRTCGSAWRSIYLSDSIRELSMSPEPGGAHGRRLHAAHLSATKGLLGVSNTGPRRFDADCNELIEIIDRRWRSETIDIISHCIVPNTTPDAFLITPAAPGAFDIGIGRMYVDGIQVENHGLPPLAYQADLGEMRGTAPVPYADQPYLPAPLPPTLAADANTTDLIYIDVWQREVTVLEDASIREIALGGPDTTTRLQSVWQVRVLEDVGRHGCGDDISSGTKPSLHRRAGSTTSAVAPPASDDPCIISPSGGYRGLENWTVSRRNPRHGFGSVAVPPPSSNGPGTTPPSPPPSPLSHLLLR